MESQELKEKIRDQKSNLDKVLKDLNNQIESIDAKVPDVGGLSDYINFLENSEGKIFDPADRICHETSELLFTVRKYAKGNPA